MSATTEYSLVQDVKSMDPVARKGLSLGVASGMVSGPLAVAGAATSGTAAVASVLLTVSAAFSGGLVVFPIAGFFLAKGIRKLHAKRQLKKLAKEAQRQ